MKAKFCMESARETRAAIFLGMCCNNEGKLELPDSSYESSSGECAKKKSEEEDGYK